MKASKLLRLLNNIPGDHSEYVVAFVTKDNNSVMAHGVKYLMACLDDYWAFAYTGEVWTLKDLFDMYEPLEHMPAIRLSTFIELLLKYFEKHEEVTFVDEENIWEPSKTAARIEEVSVTEDFVLIWEKDDRL